MNKNPVLFVYAAIELLFVPVRGAFGGAEPFAPDLLLFPVRGALGAEPFALGFGRESDASEVEPFDGTIHVVAPDHLSVRDLVADAVSRLVRVHRHVENIC